MQRLGAGLLWVPPNRWDSAQRWRARVARQFGLEPDATLESPSRWEAPHPKPEVLDVRRDRGLCTRGNI
jgi:hypothetical protein